MSETTPEMSETTPEFIRLAEGGIHAREFIESVKRDLRRKARAVECGVDILNPTDVFTYRVLDANNLLAEEEPR